MCSTRIDSVMKMKDKLVRNQDEFLKDFRTHHKYQILEKYWEKRKKECEKNLSKFC